MFCQDVCCRLCPKSLELSMFISVLGDVRTELVQHTTDQEVDTASMLLLQYGLYYPDFLVIRTFFSSLKVRTIILMLWNTVPVTSNQHQWQISYYSAHGKVGFEIHLTEIGHPALNLRGIFSRKLLQETFKTRLSCDQISMISRQHVIVHTLRQKN